MIKGSDAKDTGQEPELSGVTDNLGRKVLAMARANSIGVPFVPRIRPVMVKFLHEQAGGYGVRDEYGGVDCLLVLEACTALEYY